MDVCSSEVLYQFIGKRARILLLSHHRQDFCCLGINVADELANIGALRAEATASRRRPSAPIPFATSVDAHHLRTTTSDVRRPDPYTSKRSFHIRTTKGVAWLTMTLRSRATSAKYLPLYCDRDVIRGNVALELQEALRLKAIVLKVCTHLDCTTNTNSILMQFLDSTAA